MKARLIFLTLAMFLFTVQMPAETAVSGLVATVSLKRTTFHDVRYIEAEIIVQNRGKKPASFIVYDKPYTTFQPVVYDVNGREAPVKVAYRLTGLRADQVLGGVAARTILLVPGEKYSCGVNLADYYEFAHGREYKVRLLFLRDAAGKEARLGGNIARLSVSRERLAPVQPQVAIDGIEAEEGAIRPEEIVHLFLMAEQRERWNDYLKYIDLEQYIYSFPDYAKAYLSGGDVVKREALRDFSTYLIKSRPDTISEYKIVSETVEDGRARVSVLIKRAAAGMPFTYNYTYSLEKKSAVWMITGVTASVARDIRQ
ncbi:MAG: hypothetical protein JXK07_11765 [Spirochaetes bacterium]|nr:hypothetical protein [Spirochaetota bacterium]MBN2769911.1 hypothetical protein [Spirochaetota bacterium]